MSIPKTLKVYDSLRRENLVLDYVEERAQYITRKNMGAPKRKVYHYWAVDIALKNQVK